MTGAWKLLYAWRSPGGRRSEPPDDPDLRRPPRHRRAPLPRVRNLCHRTSQTEHESVWLVDRRSTVDLENNNGNNGGVSVGVASRVRLIRNSKLPEAVIQARERLIERLRNASLSETRESTAPSGISAVDEHAVNHNSSNDDFVYRRDETLRFLLNSNLQHVDFTLDEIEKKPCETLSTLDVEIFRNSEEIGEMKAAPECCICLESFFEGVGLFRLHCGHRFHPACLKSWVRTCSDCPYCRARIS